MNHPPEHNALEDSLRAQRPTAELVPTERAELKASLLAHARYHERAVAGVIAPTSFVRRWFVGGTMALPLLLLAVTGAEAGRSAPGELLYPVKLSIIEPIELALYHSELSPIETQVLRLERRLMEAKELTALQEHNDEASADMVAGLNEHTDTLIEELTGNDALLVSTSTLASLDRASALIAAHEELLENHTTAADSVTLENAADALESSHEAAVADLEEAGATTTLTAYVADSLHDIDVELDSDDHSSSTVSRVEQYLTEADDALADGELREAHDFISDSQQLLLTESYLEGMAEDDASLPN